MSNLTEFEQAVAAVIATGSCLATLRTLQVAIRDTRLGTKHRAVLSILAEHVNSERGTAWPSRSTMATALDYSEKTVANALYALREFGYVLWSTKSGEYVLTAPGPGHPVAGAPQPQGRGSSAPGLGQNVPQGQGKSLPQTCARDSEPTKGTESKCSAVASELALDEPDEDSPGVHDRGAKGLIVNIVTKGGKRAGERVAFKVTASMLRDLAADNRISLDVARDTARRTLEDWSARGFVGFGKGLNQAQNFAVDFARTLKAKTEAAKFTPTPAAPMTADDPRRFEDAEGWDYRKGPHPCGYPPGPKIEAALREWNARKVGAKC